jgi:hypothetical protein
VSSRGLTFEEASENISSELRQLLVSRLAAVAYFEAYRGAPWRSGLLAKSIEVEVSEDGEAVVMPTVSYAPYVIRGTAAHKIRPVNAGCLAFRDAKGGMVFARLVRHPGTKPNPFLDRAEQKTREQADEVFGDVWKEVFA